MKIKKTLAAVSVLLFSSRKIFHEGWDADPLKRIFTRVEKKISLRGEENQKNADGGQCFFPPKNFETAKQKFFGDKVGKKSWRRPSSTDLVGRPQDAVG